MKNKVRSYETSVLGEHGIDTTIEIRKRFNFLAFFLWIVFVALLFIGVYVAFFDALFSDAIPDWWKVVSVVFGIVYLVGGLLCLVLGIAGFDIWFTSYASKVMYKDTYGDTLDASEIFDRVHTFVDGN